jgi:hypothetical protein
VTDPFGVPINPKETHIRLRPVWSVDRDYGTSFHNNYATGIPYDVYLLEVSANASSGQSRLVAIDREEVHITVGLFNRVVEGLENLNVLCGTVNPLPRRADSMSVRLVGLYAEYANEGLVDEAGRYQIGDVPFGSFLLLVIDDGQIVDSRRFNSGVCLSTRRCTVDIQLPGKPIH